MSVLSGGAARYSPGSHSEFDASVQGGSMAQLTTAMQSLLLAGAALAGEGKRAG